MSEQLHLTVLGRRIAPDIWRPWWAIPLKLSDLQFNLKRPPFFSELQPVLHFLFRNGRSGRVTVLVTPIIPALIPHHAFTALVGV